MDFVKIFVSLMILFVAVNLLLTIYRLLNRKWREGLENANECGPGSYCKTWKTPPVCHGSDKPCNAPAAAAPAAIPAPVQAPVQAPAQAQAPAPAQAPAQAQVQAPAQAPRQHKSLVCPNGCTAPTELTGNCNSLEKDANGNYYKNCPYECSGPGCQYDQQCTDCGAFKITGLWDKNGNYIGQDESVQKTAASTVAGGTRAVGMPDGTLDADTADAYSRAGGSISIPSSVKTVACDVLAIHNNSAHSSTYGQWFPGQVSKLNLSQTNYEHAGRKFLNEESVKKGVRTPLVMDSEAEVLGRLLWRVHLAAITQNCMKNTPTSVTTTMNDELALMKKVHQIQNSRTESSISGTACAINTSCQPKQTASLSTTGMMTNCGDNRPGAYALAADATNSINSTVPSVSGGSSSYSSNYKPRNPNKKPKPYNSIWDIF